MLNLTGTVINVFTQQGGTNKKVNPLMIGIKFSYSVLWISQMGESKTS